MNNLCTILDPRYDTASPCPLFLSSIVKKVVSYLGFLRKCLKGLLSKPPEVIFFFIF